MSFRKFLSKIAALFRQVKIPYMVVGGLAVAYWGYPRQSLDIDVVANINSDNLTSFLKAARKLRLVIDEKEIQLISKIGNRFVMEVENFRIDCWIPKTKHEQAWLINRKQKKLFGTSIYVIGPEDLIIAKLLVNRARDIEDIKTILAKQKNKLNLPYLKHQAINLNVHAALNKLIKAN
jgi:hypothetical protein